MKIIALIAITTLLPVISLAEDAGSAPDPARQAELEAFLADKPAALRAPYRRLFLDGPERAISNQLEVAAIALNTNEQRWAQRALHGALYRIARQCGLEGKHSVVIVDRAPAAMGSCENKALQATWKTVLSAIQNIENGSASSALSLTAAAQASYTALNAGDLVAQRSEE